MSTMTVGDQAGGLTDRAQRTGKLLAGAGFDLDVSADIVSAMWHKWVFIASISALTCLAGGNVGEVVAEPGGAALGPAILDEAAAIAAAAGHPHPGRGRSCCSGTAAACTRKPGTSAGSPGGWPASWAAPRPPSTCRSTASAPRRPRLVCRRWSAAA
jgi:2-dehydropantoate 2-reductase